MKTATDTRLESLYGWQVPDYAPGHFMALVRRHNWPPRFDPQFQRTRELEQSEISRTNRERRLVLGDTGTIVGLSQRSDERLRQLLAPRLP
jgi:hypothetical protein